MSVSMKPGDTALQVTPRDDSSFAVAIVSPMMPALLAAYAAWPPLPCSPTTLVMLMMRPASLALSTSIEAARNLLTPNRLALLRAIRMKRPGSIYELAKITGRDLKNVQDDLRLLERYGLVRIGHGRSSGKRKVRIPQAVFKEIAFRIAI